MEDPEHQKNLLPSKKKKNICLKKSLNLRWIVEKSSKLVSERDKPLFLSPPRVLLRQHSFILGFLLIHGSVCIS